MTETTTPIEPDQRESETRRVLAPVAPHNYKDWTRAGFYGALGVALLIALASLTLRVGGAALSIITPFVIALVLALLLDPLVDRMEGFGMRRFFAVGIVFLVFLGLIGVAVFYGLPALTEQVTRLTDNGPQYIARLRGLTNDFLAKHHKFMGIALPKNFNAIADQVQTRATNTLRASTGKITAFLIGSISTILEVVVALIVTFYLLLDIDRLRARVFYLAPERIRGSMSIIAKDIGRVFSEYLRGLVIVSGLYGIVTLGLLFALSYWHHELAQYALLVGVAGGLLYTVPYLGPLVTAVVTFLVAFAAGGIEFGGWAVVATLILNQIFDNVITPRVVGGGVGLHPVLSLFALTLGGALFGLWGLLLSVPIAASIQAVLFRVFPTLTTPTPPAFLRAQGIRLDEEKSAKTLQGDQPHTA